MLQFQLPDLHLQFYHLHGYNPTFTDNSKALIVKLSPGITISTPSGKITPVTSVAYVDGTGYEMGNHLLLFFRYTSALKVACGFTDPGLTITIPLLMSSFWTPLKDTYTLSPASLSEHFNSCSRSYFQLPYQQHHLHVLAIPVSIRPVTVPRPVIENTSSTGIKKACQYLWLFNPRIYSFHQFKNFGTHTVYSKAEPWTTGPFLHHIRRKTISLFPFQLIPTILIINHIHFVHEYNHSRNTNLAT
jgi:hypothetical protein